MSKKENKAIEWLKYLQETREEQIRQQAWVGTNTFDAIDVILKLIEKQQKEIKELKEDKKVLVKNYNKVLGTFEKFTNENKIESDFTIIENTKEAQDEFGHNYGSDTYCISKEDIQALLLGKQLACGINENEYSLFIILEGEE